MTVIAVIVVVLIVAAGVMGRHAITGPRAHRHHRRRPAAEIRSRSALAAVVCFVAGAIVALVGSLPA